MKLRKADSQTGYHKAEVELTSDLAEQIAAYNGYLTPQEVKDALSRGERVYTAFSYYIRIS